MYPEGEGKGRRDPGPKKIEYSKAGQKHPELKGSKRKQSILQG